MFDISDGALSVHAVDDEYCLSDIMPGCTLELIPCAPQKKIKQEIKGVSWSLSTGSQRTARILLTYTHMKMTQGRIGYWHIKMQNNGRRHEENPRKASHGGYG